MGPAKAGLFKEEAKESEENEEKRVCSWQWAKGKRVLSEDKIVSSQQSAVGRQEKEFLRPFILKTLWAGLERVALLRFLCLMGGNVNKANDYYLDAAKILKF